MLQKIIFNMKPWQKFLLRTTGFIVFCIATLGFIRSVAAFMIVKVDTPEYILLPLTTLLLTFSSFTDSFLLAKSFKENGIQTGLTVGLIFVAIVIMLSLYYQTFSFTNIFLTKVTAILSAGVLGGILGVNC